MVYSERLLVFNKELDLICLPVLIGEISLWTANNEGTIFYLQTNGIIRGFNYKKKQFIVETSLAYLCSVSEDAEPMNELPIKCLKVYDGDGEKLHVELEKTGIKYFYCRNTKSWTELNFRNGLFR